jgi:hypothetical protein
MPGVFAPTAVIGGFFMPSSRRNFVLIFTLLCGANPYAMLPSWPDTLRGVTCLRTELDNRIVAKLYSVGVKKKHDTKAVHNLQPNYQAPAAYLYHLSRCTNGTWAHGSKPNK